MEAYRRMKVRHDDPMAKFVDDADDEDEDEGLIASRSNEKTKRKRKKKKVCNILVDRTLSNIVDHKRCRFHEYSL